jgi:hypothetical protein
VSETFPIMLSKSYSNSEGTVRQLRDHGVPFAVVCIPLAMIRPHEQQALRNHSQSLARLAERGGLAASEAVAILEDKNFERMTEADSHSRLYRHVQVFLEKRSVGLPENSIR